MAAAIEKSAALVAAGASAPLDIELVPGRRGAFEITKDAVLVYSKLANGRFPTSHEEVIRAL